MNINKKRFVQEMLKKYGLNGFVEGTELYIIEEETKIVKIVLYDINAHTPSQLDNIIYKFTLKGGIKNV